MTIIIAQFEFEKLYSQLANISVRVENWQDHWFWLQHECVCRVRALLSVAGNTTFIELKNENQKGTWKQNVYILQKI